jgi:hypothetical protein
VARATLEGLIVHRPTRNGAGEGIDGDADLHPVADGVAHDPVREHVLNRTEVQLALAGAVLVMSASTTRGVHAERGYPPNVETSIKPTVAA